MRFKSIWDIINDFKEEKEFEGLPYGCWHCELLGLCRAPKEQGWKCHNGCMVLNSERETKREREALLKNQNTPSKTPR
jgi:hypothetical protein